MDLINKELSKLTRLDLNQTPKFKQDPKLVVAIDRLSISYLQTRYNKLNDGSIVLPERKLNFSEVRSLLSQSPTGKVEVVESAESLLKKTNDARSELLKKIECILNNINDSAESGHVPKIVLRNQTLWSNCIYDMERVTLKSFADAKKSVLTYSSAEDKTRFNTIVFVLTKVHELLSKNLIVTRRELYYQNVSRLRNQATLDVAVRDVCCLLESPPWTLSIVATAKGLVAGPLTMKSRDGSIIDCATPGGTLIPQDVEGLRELKTKAKYILVVEKDAIFQKLLDEGALVRLGPVIIITGKGYPDVSTRRLLCRLVSELHLQALGLVDADPHGIEIFLTYKYGSLSQSHLSASLACTSMSLLGARNQDVMTLAPKEAWLKLTDTDKRKLSSMLKRPYLDTPIGIEIKAEISSILSSEVKAELEALAPSAALCDAYIPARIINFKNIKSANKL